MTKEFDILSLLEVGKVFVRSDEEQVKELVDYDYETKVKKVRSAYIDLLNKYGTSSGEVIEERRYPKPRFSLFRITSKRKCPSISENVRGGNASINIYLESMDHSELVAMPYEPTKLAQIFPDDQIIFEMKGTEVSSLSQQWENRTYYIGLHGIDRFNSSSTDFLREGNVSIEEVVSRRRQATPEELELLLALTPFLEAKYQSMQSSLPPTKLPIPRSGFFNKLLPKRAK